MGIERKILLNASTGLQAERPAVATFPSQEYTRPTGEGFSFSRGSTPETEDWWASKAQGVGE